MKVPGLASIDGKLQGQLTADVIAIQTNGSVDGKTTANHIQVAGSLTDTTTANKTLVVESTGVIAGSITYAEMEIKKGGLLQGSIYKIGRDVPASAAATTAPATAPVVASVAIPEIVEPPLIETKNPAVSAPLPLPVGSNVPVTKSQKK